VIKKFVVKQVKDINRQVKMINRK